MASDSEVKFQRWARQQWPQAWIKKIPDFKQTGQTHGRGMPDYVIAHDGNTTWWEVKQIKSDARFPFAAVNDYQWIEFSRLSLNDVDVNVVVFTPNFTFKFMFSELNRLRLVKDTPSVLFSELRTLEAQKH